MQNWGVYDTMSGAYDVTTYLSYLSTRTHLPCQTRLGFLPDALWLAGKMVGWVLWGGRVPSDADMARESARYAARARAVRRSLEKDLVDREYATVVAEYGGEGRVAGLKQALTDYMQTGVFDRARWEKVRVARKPPSPQAPS